MIFLITSGIYIAGSSAILSKTYQYNNSIWIPYLIVNLFIYLFIFLRLRRDIFKED